MCGSQDQETRRRLPHPICHPPLFRNSKNCQHDVFKQWLQKGSLFDPPLLSLSLISPIKIVCATNPSCIAGTSLASKYNPNVNSLELRARCQEMNNLCEAKQTVYWRGGVGCRWGVAGLRRRQARPEGHQSCFCQKTQSHVICFLSPLIQLRVKLLIFPDNSTSTFHQKCSRREKQMFAPCPSKFTLFVVLVLGVWWVHSRQLGSFISAL